MKAKYQGSLEALEIELSKISWAYEKNKGGVALQARTKNGMVINYFSNGTISTQNDNGNDIQILENILNIVPALEEYKDKKCNKVFIVHGHDSVSKSELENMLFRWGLEPIAIVDEASNGNTIIEHLEENIKTCAYGIVLLTPDDRGYPEKDPAKLTYRARQNVILEMGMLIAIMGRKKTVILRKGDTEPPSDIHGIIYVAFDKSVKEVDSRLRQEIKKAGISIKE